MDQAHIPPSLVPLIDDIIACYRASHPNLESLYICGSLALGGFSPGISDIDVVGVCDGPIDYKDDSKRRIMLLEIGDAFPGITFVDSAAIDKDDIPKRGDLPLVDGHVFKLASSGACIWGDSIDFSQFLPPINELVYSRTHRVELLMKKYRSGNIIEPFRKNPRLLTRSCAKAAMRALSGIAVLRGAPFHPSPFIVAKDIDDFAPEAKALKDEAMKIIDDPDNETERAIILAESSVTLFYQLFPRDENDK